MKPRWIGLSILAAIVVLPGCATNSELTPKERERLSREMERQNQRQAQEQARILRQAQGGQQRGGMPTNLGRR